MVRGEGIAGSSVYPERSEGSFAAPREAVRCACEFTFGEAIAAPWLIPRRARDKLLRLMSREIVINATKHESRIAVLDEGQVVELWVERTRQRTIVGNIYKGRVTKVLPGMQSAFVDLGLERDAFLYVSDVIEDLEDF